MTALNPIIQNCITEVKSKIKDAYIQSVLAIQSQVPEFQLNYEGIARIDKETVPNTPHIGWPVNLVRTTNMVADGPWYNVARYKDTDVYMNIDLYSVYFKFPTIRNEGFRIHNYLLRRWKRTQTPGNLHFYLTPEIWEKEIIVNNRVPTIEELWSNDINKGYDRWINTHIKNNLNMFTVGLKEHWAKEIEDA